MAEDLILIISIVAALGIGLVGGLLYSSVFGNANKRTRALEDEVDTLKREQNEYKQQVNQHFKKTADLFQGLNEQYKAIYTHMAEGSEQLCTERTSPPALNLPEKPRLADNPEKTAINETQTETSVEDMTGVESQTKETKAADKKPAEENPQEATTAQSQEDDNMLGDAPNIPDMPSKEGGKPKIH